jgi:hypothetical protein
MVLRSLRHQPASAGIEDIRRRSLDWVSRCRSRLVPGAFAFWPEDIRPPWATAVPPDVDDTVIMLGELLRHGRISRRDALRGLCTTVLRRRVPVSDAAVLPPWVVAGSFFTWLPPIVSAVPGGDAQVDVVDCCVNTNVVALMSTLSAAHLPGFREAVEVVIRGLSWAGEDKAKLRSLTPFYPSVASLRAALDHAVECGVDELRGALEQLDALPRELLGSDHRVCSSAYGRSVWRAPAVGLAGTIAPTSAA